MSDKSNEGLLSTLETPSSSSLGREGDCPPLNPKKGIGRRGGVVRHLKGIGESFPGQTRGGGLGEWSFGEKGN